MEFLIDKSAAVFALCKDGLYDKSPDQRQLRQVYIAGVPLEELIKQTEAVVRAHDKLHNDGLNTRSCEPMPLYVPFFTTSRRKNLVAALFAIQDNAKLPGELESEELTASHLLIAAYSLDRVQKIAQQVSAQVPLTLQQVPINVWRR